MSHTVYWSEAVIVGSVASGEANKYVYLLTREFGLLSAHLQSVRTLYSKLRYHTQEYSIARVALVRGREMWRLTNALEVENMDKALLNKPNARQTCIQLCALLRRLLPPEEPHPALYDELRRLVAHLKNRDASQSETRILEYTFVMRTLSTLGYFSSTALFSDILSGDSLNAETHAKVAAIEGTIRDEINRSLRATQL